MKKPFISLILFAATAVYAQDFRDRATEKFERGVSDLNKTPVLVLPQAKQDKTEEEKEKSKWKSWTLDQWRACEKHKKDAKDNPEDVKVNEIKDVDGNVWTQVSWKWVADTKPPVSGWSHYICIANHLLDTESWGPVSKFGLSKDRTEIVLWTGPMNPKSGYDPEDMFYWRIRAQEITDSEEERISFVLGPWLQGRVFKKEPRVLLTIWPDKDIDSASFSRALSLIHEENLLGKDSPFSDQKLRELAVQQGEKNMKAKGRINVSINLEKIYVTSNDRQIIISIADLQKTLKR